MVADPSAALCGRTIEFWRATARRFAVSMLPACLAACSPAVWTAPDAGGTAPASIKVDTSGTAWWKIYFRIARGESEEPAWHIDSLLADRVLAPIIAGAENRIALWRFHRRAAWDDAGHRLSLIFYSDRDTARALNNEVEKSQMVALLREEGLLVETALADLSAPAAVGLGEAADPSWPDTVQRSWPWFIMGVSQSWLGLIREVKKTRPLAEDASIGELIAYYRGIHEEVSALWREHGQHAYLHHLNALFGYQPLIIRETNLKRF